MILKKDLINWLKEGNDFSAANLIDQCEYVIEYQDTAFALDGNDEYDLFSIQCFCPRKTYSRIHQFKTETEAIEKAFHEMFESLNAGITSIRWSAQITKAEDPETIKISDATIPTLARIITGDTNISPYRSGSQLVTFFNNYFEKKDEYGQGFPARWAYAEEKIKILNEKNLIKPIIEAVTHPRLYLQTNYDPQNVVNILNEHLDYDGLKLNKIRNVFLLQKTTSSTISTSLFYANLEINTLYIEEHLSKCDKKISESDFSGAITNARSLVENVLLELEEKIQPSDRKYNGDINKLYSKVYKLLNLDPSNKEISDSMRELMSGLISMVNGLAGLRNSASDAHGSKYNPKLHHAKLAVNSAKTISDFLIESFRYQIEKGFIKL